ncbi:unnamed protein product, partial [Ectocarpus sp. 12 AP-2014]
MEHEGGEEGPAPTEDGPAQLHKLPTRAPKRSNSGGDVNLGAAGRSIGFSSPVAATPRRRQTVMSKGKSQSVTGPMGSSSVDASMWVPDDMAPNCCVCKAEFTVYRRRHHCRTCGRVTCDDCSSKRIRGDRTCLLCWDRIGRKMSGLGLPSSDDRAAAGAAGAGGVRKSALFSLIEEERYNRSFVRADGKAVSYSVAGVPDGLPVFLFLGLDSHRHSAAHFEDIARRRGLQLICIDRPGRGRSDPVPVPEVDAEAGAEVDVQGLITEATEAAVVDTIKQLCAKLRIGKAAMVGQSIGAVFAMDCARNEELKDIFEGTTVCLVSPWVPLAARGCNTFLQKASSMPALTSTVGRLGGEMMVKQVGDMARGSSGASEVEKGYLEAPYTQDLIKHVSGLKEGKGSVKNEVFLALHNKGPEEAMERCRGVIHPVKIWHGRSDQLVPYAATKWLERSLPSCTSAVIPGGTHALVYDKGSMEEVFTAAQKGVQEARSTARFAARRLSSQLSYVASNVFSPRDDTSPTAAATAAAAAGATAGVMSPRSTKKADPATPSEATVVQEGQAAGKKEDPLNLRKMVAKAISRNASGTPDSSAHSLASATSNSRHNAGTNGGSSGHGSGSGHGNGSGHGSGHGVVGMGSGHGSSGHSLSWHSNGAGGGGSGSGHGTAGRRLSALSSSSTGSRHGPGSSRHGSESAPPPIPENRELVGALDGSGGSGSSSPAGLLGEIGKQFSLALNGSFGHEGSDTGEATMPPPPPPVSKPRDAGVTAEKSLEDTLSHSEKSGVGRMAEGLLKQLDRAVSSISVGDGSGHGSGWGGSVNGAGGSAQGSAHGSVASVGALGSVVGGGARRPSGLVLPWSQQDMDQGRDGGGGRGEDEATNLDADASGDSRFGRAFTGAGAGGGTPHSNDGGRDESMGPAERAFAAAFGSGGGGGGGGAVCSTPRVTSHVKLSFGTPVTERVVSTSTSASVYGTPSRVTPSASVFGTPLRGFAADTAAPSTGSTAGGSGHGSAGPVRKSSFAIEGVVAVDKVAGYEAAMANWPAGKVEGNPAWEEWSSA